MGAAGEAVGPKHTTEIHLLFNNNAQDYAVQNARQLRLMLGEAGGFEVAQVAEE